LLLLKNTVCPAGFCNLAAIRLSIPAYFAGLAKKVSSNAGGVGAI
jgi:hypothetical protein